MSRKGWLLFIAVSIFWGIPYLFIKIAVQELDPSVVVFARAVIAATILIPMAVHARTILQLFRHWPTLLIFSLIHMFGSFLLISYGEQHLSSSLSSLLIAANPLLVAVLALGFDKSERVNGFRLLGLLVGLIGLIVLLGFDLRGDGQQWLGALFILLAATGYAIGALMLKHEPLVKMSRVSVAAAECSITAILLLPFTITRLPSSIPSPQVLVSLLILGLICTALALPTFFALIAEVGASRGSVITYINPAISVLLGVTFLHEQFTIATVAGFLLIIGGSYLSTTGSLPFRAARKLPKSEVD
ncbi:DMT family transporter [Ktedonosporobacter rubrisoli]|uniref:DMT family transporter n=1 Tax=Ktedonosporobacter rubrisoli TaxID=2509675 RepID=A0A4P6JIM0_KTERU|nr:DMT family transporter [Ktedonosporobacter rubrisoli]QBD74927.1 DMT family transporter [Ktedonosporobacter rubrisoli]